MCELARHAAAVSLGLWLGSSFATLQYALVAPLSTGHSFYDYSY